MSLKDFFLDNYVMLYELIGLLLILAISVHISKRMKRLTQAVIILIFIETVVFWLEKWTQTFDHLSIMRPMFTAALYSVYPVILVLMMFVTSTNKMSKKRLLILLIPEFVSVPLFFTSQWTHLIFYFHEHNFYSGSDVSDLLSWWPYILFGFYTTVFIIHTFIYFRRYTQIYIPIAIFILFFPISGVVFYVLTDSGKDYGALFTSAVLLYYVYVYIHTTKIDPLTSLLNRQSYYKDMQAKGLTGVASIDMNDLKLLNDNFGHEAGDFALRVVSGIMRRSQRRGITFYRVGGDEFMILFTHVKEDYIASFISKLQEDLDLSGYPCAVGYAPKLLGDSAEDAIRESDRRMYENKAAMKAEKHAKEQAKAGKTE